MGTFIIKKFKEKKESCDLFGEYNEGMYIICIFLIGFLSGILLTLKLTS